MTTTPEQIDLWRSSPSEHPRLEFKEAKTQFDNHRLYKYCVAMANEGGGHLVLGVADAPPRPVVGTAAVNNPIEMAEKLFHVRSCCFLQENTLFPSLFPCCPAICIL
jgi:predicted HTH transcriptional regulator